MATVLVIDDNADLRDMMRDMLALKQHQVVTATNGKDGLNMVRTRKPDVIFCDIAMPQMDGFEVFHAIQADTELAGTPFVFLTASITSNEEKRIIETGAHGLLTKPYRITELFALLDKILTDSSGG